MSGIEVVGLVLGAFPLAVSALEHYREACKTINLMRNFESEWRKSLNDIKDEQVFFTLNLKVLLLPLVEDDALDETDLETLLADPESVTWRDIDVDAALGERLGSSHARFLEIALELQRLIWQLLTVIGIDKPRLQAKLRLVATTFEYRKEQLKFGLGRAQREEVLKEIRTNNKKLDRLLEKSDKIQDSSRVP
ncbi:hypothetical protein LTR85_007129 [Meristemomyces frigidus]|nr:hypothetical protein LTR85_007129 [Meristemomyces frigidus]